MKKKIVSVLLTAAMAATMFAGCGSKTDSKTDGGSQSADSKTDSGSDGEDMIRKGVAKYLQLHTDRFSKIYEAENGQEAIDLTLRYQPDMLLLDVQMPVKTGLDVMKEVQKAGLEPVTVILSGYDAFSYAQQAVKFGARDYLLKPVRAADILNTLNELADKYIGKETEVAYKVGFNDEKYFSKVFKKIKGMTPKEYRMSSKH